MPAFYLQNQMFSFAFLFMFLYTSYIFDPPKKVNFSG